MKQSTPIQPVMIEYESKTVGTRRKILVYPPPGYSKNTQYPVLYLLHGIGGDDTEWQRLAPPQVTLGKLLADGNKDGLIRISQGVHIYTQRHKSTSPGQGTRPTGHC
ncbi:MAG: alpha/beta hydrolase-fold protein, partial [Verrucomicrobiota bacterium]